MRTKLAYANIKTGVVKVNKRVKDPDARRRIERHEKIFVKARQAGKSFTEARRLALKAEHKGMTKHQVQVYEGKLGAVARRKKP